MIALALLTAAATAQGVQPGVIVVSPQGPVRSITAALAGARPHGRILVRAGTYREPTLLVDRPVELVGEPGAVIDGEGQRQLMIVTADDVTIRGLGFRRVGSSFQADRSAIRITGARDCRIEDNTIDQGFFGIHLTNVHQCRLLGNRLRAGQDGESVSGNGIHLWSSDSILIADNRISGFRDGIYFEFVHQSEVRNNLSEKNLRYGLHFMYSDGCRYRENTFRANGSGIAVMFTRDVEMTANRFEDNWGGAAYGLLLKEITDSRLVGNRFRGNTVGLLVEGGTRLEARNNEFSGNGWGIRLSSSTQDARFLANTFAGNTFDVATNSAHATAEFAGNFWDGYRGYDLDRDGRGDVPYHPVRLFSLLVEHNEPSLLMLRSVFVHLLDLAERAIPSLTPDAMADASPAMKRVPEAPQ
ncbi:MAG TPA: nitrous oxide reductase family maturation protein NosD [Gemmatimonadales bacterium]|nr:nitrous oxide reductase family maturation protein NosD [Gemmatimonadales bacterium]